MADKKTNKGLNNKPDCQKVISILPFLKNNKHPIDIRPSDIKEGELVTDEFKIFLDLEEMGTDDLAGSLLAYYLYDLYIFEFENTDSNLAMARAELKTRAEAHLELYNQININFLL
tara:strand:- start:3321 stop:3668 length:348 start_codon:yes stop_codon:yes gene_type:complete